MNAEDVIDRNACHVCDGELHEGWRVGCDDLVFRAGAKEAVEVKEKEMRLKAIEAFNEAMIYYTSPPYMTEEEALKHFIACLDQEPDSGCSEKPNN